jgi:hypothetical protein
MLRKKKDEIEWLEFDLLSDHPELFHAVFLRHGGISSGTFSSLNAGSRADDHPYAVKRNMEKIREITGVPLIMGNQVHGTKIAAIPFSDPSELHCCDGLMTEKKNLGLLVKHADCQAAIFYDPIRKAVANVHCGWRGNVQNIYRETVQKMKDQFKTRPEDLLVCISPSLGPDASEFKNYQTEWPESFWSFQFKPTYFDLWAISRFQLEECGVLTHHIEIANICTYSNPQDFFSYRREKNCGNHATVVVLKNRSK